MFDPLTPIISEQHRDKLMQEAAKRRSLAAISTARPPWKERLCVGFGGFLVSIGSRLQAPYRPALPARSETLQPGH